MAPPLPSASQAAVSLVPFRAGLPASQGYYLSKRVRERFALSLLPGAASLGLDRMRRAARDGLGPLERHTLKENSCHKMWDHLLCVELPFMSTITPAP